MTAGRRRIAAYQRALRAHARAVRVTQAVLDGLALGVMDRATLAELDERFFGRDAREVVDGKRVGYAAEENIVQGLFGWEREMVERHFPREGRVVITGAGAGREVLGLAALGLDPVGYEPHAGLVRAGEEVLAARGLAGRLRVSARDTFPEEVQRADAVVIGWGSYMLVPGRDRRLALLRSARAVLTPGDPLLVSFVARNPDSRDLRVVAAVARPLRRLRRDEPVELGDWLGPNFVHVFTEDEIRAELRAGGFEPEFVATTPYGHAVARAA